MSLFRDQPFRAFPSNAINPACGGMSLREWFAGQALPAIIAATSAGQHMPQREGMSIVESIVADAYAMADAMMKHREKSDG